MSIWAAKLFVFLLGNLVWQGALSSLFLSRDAYPICTSFSVHCCSRGRDVAVVARAGIWTGVPIGWCFHICLLWCYNLWCGSGCELTCRLCFLVDMWVSLSCFVFKRLLVVYVSETMQGGDFQHCNILCNWACLVFFAELPDWKGLTVCLFEKQSRGVIGYDVVCNVIWASVVFAYIWLKAC